MAGYPWTQKEDEILKEWIGKISVDEIVKRDLLPGRTTSSVHSHCSVAGIKNSYKPKLYIYDEDFWAKPNLINSYFAGFTAADGCLYVRPNSISRSYLVCLSVEDIGHLQKLKELTKYTGPITSTMHKSPVSDNITEQVRFRVDSRKWFEDLGKNFNIIPKKTYRLAPPNLLSDEMKWAYIMGYIDGDGCLHLSHSEKLDKDQIFIQITSCSKAILDWINETIESKFKSSRGYTIKVGKVKNSNSHIYTISGERVIKLYLYLTKLQVPYLARKWSNPEVISHIKSKIAENPTIYSDFLDPISHSHLLTVNPLEQAEYSESGNQKPIVCQ